MECSFSPDHYLECLTKADDKGFHISPVGGFTKFKPSEKVLLLRHDVDFSLEYAYEMANMEHAIGYYSTYYILVHGPFYNPLSERSMDAIKAIHGMGHEIGLQVDTRYHADVDLKILESITGSPVTTFAKHYFTITDDTNLPYNLLNSRDIPARYISESGRHWREGCMCDNIDKHKQLQVLTHPIWWFTDSKTREAAVNTLEVDLSRQVSEDVNEYRNILDQYIIDEKIAC